MTGSTTRMSRDGCGLSVLKSASIRIGLLAGTAGCALALHLTAAAAGPTEKVLYSFAGQPDGQSPYAGLIKVKGALYGTTGSGGTNGAGAAFAVDRKTGAETVLYSFCSQQQCADGSSPQGNLVEMKGTLYGTTYYGGGNLSNEGGCGTVFALDPTTKAETVLYAFCHNDNSSDGQNPQAGLINVKGTLYGTTVIGGGSGCNNGTWFTCGEVFSFNPSTATQTVLYRFCSQSNCTDGAWPYASLTDVNGTLYGTTTGGGSNCANNNNKCGTVFSLDLATNSETVVYNFCGQQNCADGAFPYANLIDVNGTLYGTTLGGGTDNEGVVFALDPATGAETVLYSFCSQQNCVDGSAPVAGVTDVNGTLYGTTYHGGAGNGGTVFSLNPATGTENWVYSFCSQQNCADGEKPWASLIDVRGKLYGTTGAGGTSNDGTVFVLTHP